MNVEEQISYIKGVIADIQERHQRELEPFIKMLTGLYDIKPPGPLYISKEYGELLQKHICDPEIRDLFKWR